MTGERRPSEAGMSMVALIAGMSIMFIMMSAAVPAWRYVMKDAREEELLFRGEQIARGVECYSAKFKQPPVNLEVMVQQKCLRKAYKEPFAKDGKWRFIRQGEVIPMPGAPALPGPGPGPGATPRNPGEPGQAGQTGRQTTATGQPALGGGPFQGVVSFSKEKSLRIMNGTTHYNEWYFIPNRPRIMGRNFGVVNPGVTPTPKPSTGPGIRPPEQQK
jgi:type II secretory pathway pseudopilin PulG